MKQTHDCNGLTQHNANIEEIEMKSISVSIHYIQFVEHNIAQGLAAVLNCCACMYGSLCQYKLLADYNSSLRCPEMEEKQTESVCYLSTLKLRNLDCYIDKRAQL